MLIKEGALISRVVFYLAGTMHSAPIKVVGSFQGASFTTGLNHKHSVSVDMYVHLSACRK